MMTHEGAAHEGRKSLICVPIVDANVEAATEATKKAKSLGADLVELRLDYLGTLDDGKLGVLIEAVDIPKIATIRTEKAGGFWKGDEKTRINHLLTCLSFGAEYVDIEDSTDIGWRYEIAKACRQNNAQLIISHHEFKKQLAKRDMIDICNNAFAAGANIAKIAVAAQTSEDVCNVLSVIEHFKAQNKSIIGIAMGKLGTITRVLGPQLGAFLTYASLEKGKESAEGQLTIEELKTVMEILRVK